jgi:hypothetical protein
MEVTSRFRNLTLFGFSLGSIILNAIDRELHRFLLQRGYEPSEAAQVSGYLVIITVGDVAFGRIRNPESDAMWRIPAISVASTLDIFASPTLVGFLPRKKKNFYRARASCVGVRKRIAITAPVAHDWQSISETRNRDELGVVTVIENRDPTGHTPSVYLKLKVGAARNSLLIPVIVRELLHAMLDPKQRPFEPLQWFNNPNPTSLLYPYFHERLEELVHQLNASKIGRRE